MKTLRTGILITLEGIDGSGKSTLAGNLHTLFASEIAPVLLTKEPGGCQLGHTIRTVVQQQTCTPIAEFLLFAADRAQHVADTIAPALAKKTLIISDRFADSSVAYQGYGRGLAIPLIQNINAWALQGVVPQLTIYVKVPLSVAHERIALRGEKSSFEQEKHSFLERVAHGFDTLYAQHPAVMIVDGTHTPDIVAHTTYTRIMEWLLQRNYLQSNTSAQHSSGLDQNTSCKNT